MYKYGIISTASITKRFITGLREANDEVVCIASRDIEKARRFALDNSIERYYGSYDEVYKDKDVDIVYIPVINKLHFECAKNALLNKKHVVLEKPFTTNSKDAQELFKLAKENNCFIFEGVKNLFVPSTQFIKKHLLSIGEINTITTSQGVKVPLPKGHWMYDYHEGGGAFVGSYAYVFHYLRYLFGTEITALKGKYIPSDHSDLSCEFSFRLNKIEVNSSIDMSKDLDNTCVIYGSRGKIVIDEFWRSHHVLVEMNDGSLYEYKDEGNEFVYEARHIQECINKGLIESPIIKGYDSIKEIEDIELIYNNWKFNK